MRRKRNPMSIAVLDKTFSLLEVLARLGRAAPLADLSRESRLPKPTVYRILRSLRDLGYVVQADRGGAYSLSERLQSLGGRGRDELLREKAGSLMRGLHAEFDETVNLGVLEGIYVRYAWVLETTHALRWIVKPGARDPFHTTALGRAIVADMPAEAQARLVAKVSAGAPARSRAALRDRLRRELELTRARGFALEEEETNAGVACAAVSLAPLQEPLAAVSVSVPVSRFPAARRAAIIAALRRPPERVAAEA